MKLYELISGATITLSNEEDAVVQKVKNNEPLDERDNQVAFFLLGRGIFERNGDKYRVIEKPDVWRD